MKRWLCRLLRRRTTKTSDLVVTIHLDTTDFMREVEQAHRAFDAMRLRVSPRGD